MSDNIFDLYVDYLLSSFGLTTAAGLSAVLEKQISHDRIARMLSGREKTSADLFRYVLTDVRFASAENMMFDCQKCRRRIRRRAPTTVGLGFNALNLTPLKPKLGNASRNFYCFSILTAQALYSAVSVTGSNAGLVSQLALPSLK